jgi:hypothetical protein
MMASSRSGEWERNRMGPGSVCGSGRRGLGSGWGKTGEEKSLTGGSAQNEN